MPRGRKRASFRFAVTDHYRDNEIRIIERCSIPMREGVPELATFMNRTGRLRCAVRADSSGERKLLEESKHARFVSALVRINLGVVAFEIAIGKRGWRTVTRTRNVNDIQVVLLDETVQKYTKKRM